MNEIKIAVAAQRLVNAAERMCESLPIYSESSAAFTRHKELREAIEAAKKALEQSKG
jgi:hypothetical protein